METDRSAWKLVNRWQGGATREPNRPWSILLRPEPDGILRPDPKKLVTNRDVKYDLGCIRTNLELGYDPNHHELEHGARPDPIRCIMEGLEELDPIRGDEAIRTEPMGRRNPNRSSIDQKPEMQR